MLTYDSMTLGHVYDLDLKKNEAQIKAVIMPTLAYCADVWPGLGSPGRSSAQQDAYPDKELLPELQGQSE